MKFFLYALAGIVEAIKTERNVRIHILATVIVIILGLYYKVSLVEWSILLLCIGSVISLEMLNTAIEKLCDFVMPEYNEVIKKVKDIAAGAVLFFSIISFIIGCFIFIPKIM